MKKELHQLMYLMAGTLKILFLQIIFTTTMVAGDLSAQIKSVKEVYVNINLQNQTLLESLRAIEEVTDYSFSYDKHLVKNNSQRINYASKNESVESILLHISDKFNLKFKQINQVINVLENDNQVNVPEIETIIDQVSVTGTITDGNGEPLPGATIQEIGTTNGTISNADGFFSLSVAEDAQLTISFIGFKTQEISLNGRTELNVSLEADVSSLDEVVVVGYGAVKQRDVTGSITSVDEETIDRMASAGNILGTIQGAVPGLNVITNSSSAEQNSSLQIRGVKSITASNDPLIILDGVPFSGSLSELPIADIQSIEVLKDASSAAIYGSRGANGVIIVTTKKGKGATTVQVQSKYGILQLANKPDLWNGEEFYDKKYEYWNRSQGLTDVNDIFQVTELENYAAGVSTDWIDEVTRMGEQHDHTLSISGGSEKQSFYTSVNLLNTKGIAINDDFSRYTLRLNYNNTITPWLKLATNTQATYLDRDGLSADFVDAYYMNPLTTPYNEDGSPRVYPWPERNEFANPLENTLADNLDREYKLFSNNYLDVDLPFVEGLNYRINTGVSASFRNIETYFGRDTQTGFENKGSSRVSNTFETRYLVEHILSYKKDFGDHSIFLTGLYSFQKDESRMRGLNSLGFPSDILTTWQASTATLITPNSSYLSYSQVSQMFRMNYSFMQNYSLTATVRRDGFSGFGKETKYGIFPSLGVAWNIGDEDFLANANWINFLKLRTSWGKNGNQGIDPYSTQSRMMEYNYLGGPTGTETAPGYLPATLANPNLGWETTRTLDMGIDFGFFDGKLSGSVSIYQSYVTDLLLNRQISSTFGIPGSSIRQNIGETENRGYEIDLFSDLITRTDFEWNLGFNISAFSNKIIDLYGDKEDDVLNEWFIGEPINVIYGYVHDGIWQSGQEGEIANSPLPDQVPGSVKVLDADGDGQITPDDRRIQGSVYPDFRAGFNSYIRYKDISLNMMFFAVVGVEKIDQTGNINFNWEYRRNLAGTWDYWTEENPSNRYPGNFDGAIGRGFTPLFLEDASYLRLRDVKLTYDLTRMVSTVGIQNCSVFFNINNAFTLTNWPGMDPELAGASQLNIPGISGTAVPPQRTFLFGLNLKF